jgi:hypothetical protein
MTPKEKKTALADIAERRSALKSLLAERRGAVEGVDALLVMARDEVARLEALRNEHLQAENDVGGKIRALDLQEQALRPLRPRLKRLLAQVVSGETTTVWSPILSTRGGQDRPSTVDDAHELERLGFVVVERLAKWGRDFSVRPTAAGKAKAKEGA